jgi:hypothetical protein
MIGHADDEQDASSAGARASVLHRRLIGDGKSPTATASFAGIAPFSEGESRAPAVSFDFGERLMEG